MHKEDKVVETFPFLVGDSRWSGHVEVVEAVVTRDDKPVVYTNLRIRIGNRFLNLPRRIDEVIDALIKGRKAAQDHYNNVLRQMNEAEKKD